MKIIVFGGSGFLGGHVTEALLNAGHNVTVFDLKCPTFNHKKLTWISGDILNETQVNQAVKGHEALYNFAGLADIEVAQSKPLETIRANILGNGILLEAARQNQLKRFIYASTVYAYSAAGSFYRDSKKACESYIESYWKTYNLPFTVLRYGTLYGPRSDTHNGIFRLITQAVKQQRIEYWGTGDELREYIHVKDAALSSVDILSKEFENEAVTITGQQPMRVRDFLNMLNEMSNKKIKIIYKPTKPGNVKNLHYSVTPYSFIPKEGKKLVRTHFVDFGQGILNLMGDIYSQVNAVPTNGHSKQSWKQSSTS